MKYLKAKKPISANHKKLGELKVDGAEVPQFESIAEYIQAVKGEQNGLNWINSQYATAAKNVGRALLRTAEDTAKTEELFPKVLAAVKNYVPDASGDGVSVKSKAEQRDMLKARLESGEQLTREQLLEMLA